MVTPPKPKNSSDLGHYFSEKASFHEKNKQNKQVSIRNRQGRGARPVRPPLRYVPAEKVSRKIRVPSGLPSIVSTARF